MDEETEKILINRAQSGDRDAFEDLLSEYYETMYKMALKYCGQIDHAEDITQSACIKVAQNIDQFSFKSKFTTWIYTIVINTAKDWYKANNRHALQPLSDSSPEKSAHHNPEKDAYNSELLAYIQTLPSNEKDAIILVFGQGLSHAEAAEILKVKESTVSWYIHEARKKLEDFNSKHQEQAHG
jgi:RNA polymerase sigma-70 factor (ECF subfamily)